MIPKCRQKDSKCVNVPLIYSDISELSTVFRNIVIMCLADRLTYVLHGRMKHKWGKDIGITKSVIDSLWKGKIPGADKLSPAIRAENLSLSWLLEGMGNPYLVNHCTSDEECYSVLDEMYAEEWKTYIVTDGCQIAIVLTQPGSYQIKDDPYLYTIIEVLTGNIGDDALNLVLDNVTNKTVFHIETSCSTMNDLIRGNVGTYQLLHAENALLSNAHLIQTKMDKQDQPYLQCAENKASYNLADSVSSTEMATIEDLRKLDPHDIAHIKAVIKSLAHVKN